MTAPSLSYPGHAKAVLVLGLPLVGGHLAQFAIGMTDTVMLGWYGVKELAAVTLGGSYFYVFYMMGTGFALAVMPMVAAFDAAHDETGLRRATRMGLWLSALFATLMMPMIWWSEPILLALGQGPEVTAVAVEYLRVAGWGLYPALLVMVLKSYLAAMGRTQIVLWITIAAAVVNALVNYALIFGNWGAPELGVVGAAMASIAVQIVSLVGVVIYTLIVFPHHTMFRRLWRADWPMFGQVLWLGAPIGLTMLSEVSLFTASALMMGWLGTVPLAAHGIAVQLASAAFMLHLGLSNAATIRAGSAYGRGDRAHMARGAHTVTVISLLFALFSITLFLLIPVPLLSLFLEPTEPARDQIISIGIGLLAMAALFQLVDGAQVIALGLLRGVQDTGVPMVIAALSYWAVGIPSSYVLGFMVGLDGIGVWLGLVIGLAFAGAFLMLRFWRRSIRRVGADVTAKAG